MNKLLIIFAVLYGSLYGQVSVDLTIESQQAVGTDFFFDIYLARTGTNNLYLGNADFVLTFDAANFNTPALSKGASSPGGCTFVPTDQSGFNTMFTQDAYYQNIAVSILNANELTINLNGPTPSTQTGFDTRVAVINNSSSIHRLGTFKVSGIINPGGNMNLQWKISSTLVFTLANTPPFASSPATVNAINPLNAPLPVELTSFTADANGDKVDLIWETATEVNNYGFDIERASLESFRDTPGQDEWKKIGFVEGSGNSSSPKSYKFTDNKPAGGNRFVYRLKQINNDGSYEYSGQVEVELIPGEYKLYQNYPNPFNPTTTIQYQLPRDGRVTLKIYDILGSEIATLIDKEQEAGYKEVQFNGSNYASGMYIYRLNSGSFSSIKKMLIVK